MESLSPSVNSIDYSLVRRHRLWQTLMQGESGLAELQGRANQALCDRLVNGISNSLPAFRVLLKRIERPNFSQNCNPHSIQRIHAMAEHGLETVRQPFLATSVTQFHPKDTETLSVFLPDQDSQESVLAKDLLVSADVMKQVLASIIYKSDFYNFDDESEDRKDIYSVGTDLKDPRCILTDNIVTMLDVFRTTCNATDASSQLDVMHKIVNTIPTGEVETARGVKDVNPFEMTQLELCAQAPFGMWAYFRSNVPVSVHCQPVVNAQGFSDEFLYAVSRGKWPVDTEFLRHGGCPALVKDGAPSLITESANVFVEYHKAVLKERGKL